MTIIGFDEDDLVTALVALIDEVNRWRRERDRYLAGRLMLRGHTRAEIAQDAEAAGFMRLIESPVDGALNNAIILIGEHVARHGEPGAHHRILEAVAEYGQSDGSLSDDEREHNAFMRRGLLTYRWHRWMAQAEDEPA